MKQATDRESRYLLSTFYKELCDRMNLGLVPMSVPVGTAIIRVYVTEDTKDRVPQSIDFVLENGEKVSFQLEAYVSPTPKPQ